MDGPGNTESWVGGERACEQAAAWGFAGTFSVAKKKKKEIYTHRWPERTHAHTPERQREL